VGALVRALLEAVADDALERGRDRPVRRQEVRRLFLEDCRHGVGGRVAAEGPAAREHLVEDRAEAEEVGSVVRGQAAELLGRHVPERPQDGPRLRALRLRREVRRAAPGAGLDELREAEVEDLDPAVLRDEKVLGLEVPVDDSLLVGGRESPGDLDGEVHRLAHGQRAGGETRAQRFAFEELHHEDWRRTGDFFE
jgi:hypothetical protein